MQGDVYEWGKVYLRNDKWTNKIIDSFVFPNLHINHFTNDSNSRNNKLIGVWKIHKWIWGAVYEVRESFLSHDKWHDKIIEWFILQFISYILWMTQTKEKITCIGFWKFLNGYDWDVYELGAKIPKAMTSDMIKLLSDFFYNSYFTILQMTQTQEIINS